jgi:hypothetical protein
MTIDAIGARRDMCGEEGTAELLDETRNDAPLCRSVGAFCYFFPVRACLKTAIAALAVVAALVAGCGSERPPPAGQPGFGTAPPPVGGFGGDGGANSKPPGCGQKDDGTFCDCVDVPLFVDPPNMYFVLDHSGSMSLDNKWTQVRYVMADIVRGLGPRANFGATLFPGSATADCGPPTEIVPISPGDPVGTGSDGPTTKALLSTTSPDPEGGTPTAAALRFVLPILTKAKGKTFVILATDGAPNCNASARCTAADCQPNIESAPGCAPSGPSCCEPPQGDATECNDSAPTISAVAALAAANIPVYVVGLPGTNTYSSLLDQLAVSGGTALPGSPKYYKVDSTMTNAALLSALKKIAAKIVATCEFTLKEEPKQANQVNVYLDEVVLPHDPVNGWKIEGAKVTLLGTACSRVLNGDVFDVRIITGCPTVEPR